MINIILMGDFWKDYIQVFMKILIVQNRIFYIDIYIKYKKNVKIYK